MRAWILWVAILQAGAGWLPAPAETTIKAQAGPEAAETVAARKARDRADVEELQRTVLHARKEAATTNAFEAYLRVALFEAWLCEAIESRHDDKLFKQAAEGGVAAAEKAVSLNPRSSQAHQLLGDLLGQLIPHVFGGGMRYGKRSSDELDKALELDPKNVEACVSRAISYYYSPEYFGGSKAKAFELLNRAVEIDALADTPHIWLALFYLDAERKQDAAREIKLGLAVNSGRAFAKFVSGQVDEALKRDQGTRRK